MANTEISVSIYYYTDISVIVNGLINRFSEISEFVFVSVNSTVFKH